MNQLGQSRNDARLWTYLVVKVESYKEQYFIGTWNVRSMNQGKLDVVKQEMARRNINILGISELKWTGMKSESRSEATQLCPTLCDPMDCSIPGSSVHRTFQARVLEWVAIFFSRGSSQLTDRAQVSHIVDRCFSIWATSEVSNRNGWI